MRRSRVFVFGSFLAVAALAAAIVVLAVRARHAARVREWNQREAATRGPESADDADVSAFAGEIETGQGARLTVRVARLHAGDRQQRFDAQALARRFGLAKGEPFLCEISARGDALIAAGALRSIAIQDEKGPALAPFPAIAAADSEPADPLATLLAPPTGELRGGFAVSVVLWGRAPETGARCAGLGGGDVALAPTHLASRDLDTALARIDAQNASAAGAPK